MLQNFEKFKKIEINRNSKSLNLSLFVFIFLFALTAFGRFSNEFLYSPFVYPTIFNVLIEKNREIFGALLVALVSISYFTNAIRKFPINLYWAPITLHFFLSLKLLINGNADWLTSFFGAFSLLVSVFVCTNATRQLFNFDRFVKFCMIIVVFLIACAIYQYLMVGQDNMQNGSRFFFFSIHPNHAGITWAFSALTITFLLIHDNLRYQLVKVVLLLTCLFFLFLTGSRGSFISGGAGIAALLFLGSGKKQKNFKLYLLILVLLLGLFIFFWNYINDFYSAQVERGNTRTDVYAVAINSFLSFPIFGLPYKSGRPAFVENLILSYMMSAGIFGILLCTAFYSGAFSILRRAFIKIKKTKDMIPSYFISIFFMMMVSSLFESFQISFITFGSFISIFAATYLMQYVRRT